jgi:hypothetical protein
LFKVLKKSYFYQNSWKIHQRNAFVISLFVFLFLFVFRPFGLNTLQSNIFFICAGYGLTCFLILTFLNSVFTRFFSQLFDEERWTVGKEILWTSTNVALVGLGNSIYTAIIGIGEFSLFNIFWFEVYTIALSVFPISIAVIMNENRLHKKFSAESRSIASKIENKSKLETHSNKLLRIPSENGNEDFELQPEQLVYIQSFDNYVEIYYLYENKPLKKVIRSSLKLISNTLQTTVFFSLPQKLLGKSFKG